LLGGTNVCEYLANTSFNPVGVGNHIGGQVPRVAPRSPPRPWATFCNPFGVWCVRVGNGKWEKLRAKSGKLKSRHSEMIGELDSISVVEAGRVDALTPAARGGGRFRVGNPGAAVNELEDFGRVLVHGREGGAEEAVEGFLRREAGGESVRDAEEHFAIAEVEVKGALSFAVVHARQKLCARATFGRRDLDGNTAEKGDDGAVLGRVHGGSPEQLLSAAADKEDVAVFSEGGLEFPGFQEVGGSLQYRVHRIDKCFSLFGGTMRPTIK